MSVNITEYNYIFCTYELKIFIRTLIRARARTHTQSHISMGNTSVWKIHLTT